MRAVVRVGVVVGCGAVLVLFALQQVVALAAVLGILATGVLAGMGAAKWLEWSWYGRQFEAGAKTGGIACGLAGLATVLSLLLFGPRSSADLAARSHVPGIDLASLIRGFTWLGWIGTDLLAVLLATALGVGLAVLAASLFALGKNSRAVEAITQARHAAQALHQHEAASVPLAGHAYGASTMTGTPWHTTPLAPPLPPLGLNSAPHSHTLATPPPSASSPAPTTGDRSSDPPVERVLNEDERDALAQWAAEHAKDHSGARTPAPSAYLNGEAPTPKRNRKKQQTRDWLC